MKGQRIYPLTSALIAIVMAVAAVAGVTIEFDPSTGVVRIRIDGDSQVIIEGESEPDIEPATWPLHTITADSGVGWNQTWKAQGSQFVLEDTLIESEGAQLGIRVQVRRGEVYESLALRRVVVRGPPLIHGAFVIGVKNVVVEDCIFDMRGRKPDTFDHSFYLRASGNGTADFGANVTFRRCVFLGGPGYGLKVRSNSQGGFARVLIEDCVFIDCPEAIGFKPDNTELTEPQRSVEIRGCVFVHTPAFVYPENWKARELVRLFRAGSLVFVDNLSINTDARADQPEKSIAHASWPDHAKVEGNEHRSDSVGIEPPETPSDIAPTLEALRQ